MNEKEIEAVMERTAQSSFQVFTEFVQLWASGARKVPCMNFLRPLFFCRSLQSSKRLDMHLVIETS
jgi:hypothetical protein